LDFDLDVDFDVDMNNKRPGPVDVISGEFTWVKTIHVHVKV